MKAKRGRTRGGAAVRMAYFRAVRKSPTSAITYNSLNSLIVATFPRSPSSSQLAPLPPEDPVRGS